MRGFAVLAPSRKGEEDIGEVGEEAMSQAVGESQGEEPSHKEPGYEGPRSMHLALPGDS